MRDFRRERGPRPHGTDSDRQRRPHRDGNSDRNRDGSADRYCGADGYGYGDECPHDCADGYTNEHREAADADAHTHQGPHTHADADLDAGADDGDRGTRAGGRGNRR